MDCELLRIDTVTFKYLWTLYHIIMDFLLQDWGFVNEMNRIVYFDFEIM